MPIWTGDDAGSTLGQADRNSVDAYVEAVGGWQETVTNRQSERVTTFVFTEIEGVLHVA